ncbi:hypothetical protein, partial [Streptomyces apricus]|uniref:hypothetical protein n=1 Tax=Streptomyces apricus TaxID=1828112 RepID=UPI00165F9838
MEISDGGASRDGASHGGGLQGDGPHEGASHHGVPQGDGPDGGGPHEGASHDGASHQGVPQGDGPDGGGPQEGVLHEGASCDGVPQGDGPDGGGPHEGASQGDGSHGDSAYGDVLRRRAEALKLARLLDVEPGRLAFLEELPADDVRLFRERAVAALFDDDRGLYDRVAGMTRLLPAGVAAGISQKALGPRLAAALAGRLEPGRAAEIIDRLPAAFTARCCHHVDPRRIAGIMGLLDDDLVVRIALVLAERGDHLTMGRFVGHLRDSALRSILPRLEETTLLRTGFVIDHPERLGHIVALLDDERLSAVIAAAADHALWPQALAVAGMAGDQRARIASLTAAQPEARLDSLIRATAEQDLWESLLPIVSLLGEDELRAVAALPALREAGV